MNKIILAKITSVVLWAIFSSLLCFVSLLPVGYVITNYDVIAVWCLMPALISYALLWGIFAILWWTISFDGDLLDNLDTLLYDKIFQRGIK